MRSHVHNNYSRCGGNQLLVLLWIALFCLMSTISILKTNNINDKNDHFHLLLIFSSAFTHSVPRTIETEKKRKSVKLIQNYVLRSVPSSASLAAVPNVFDADREKDNRAKKQLSSKWCGLGNSGVGSSPSNLTSNSRVKNDQEWKFFDTARIHVSGGDGGNGCVSFRREKGEPMGGPNGGNGGKGGSVYLICDRGMNTLAPLRNHVHIRATKACNGLGNSKQGQKGKDIYIPVPPGTIIRELRTQKLAGELREDGGKLLVARGGRGGRGNAAFMTQRNTAPKICERGEPGDQHWLSVELRLVADVGLLGKPNAGKSTLLASASAARPKIANYPFTTTIPNLGVCDISDDGAGLILCDIPGLIEGAAEGAGLGPAFLRHVQRCKILLHVVDGSSQDPIGDFVAINKELEKHDPFLASKPQVVVLNKVDIPEVKERSAELSSDLKKKAGHSRVLTISAATTKNVKELMSRLRKFASVQPGNDLQLPEADLTKAALDYDSDDYEIMSDLSYPGQWRVSGKYIEQIAKMTHWEYPEAVARFARQLDAIGISKELEVRGAVDGDLVMVDEYDFEFNSCLTNQYIPQYLLDREFDFDDNGKRMKNENKDEEEIPWRPFSEGGFLDVDSDELDGFLSNEWEFLSDDGDNLEDDDFVSSDDKVWTSS